MNSKIDLSEELQLYRFNNGIQLRQPAYDTPELCLADLKSKHVSVYFKKFDYTVVDANFYQLQCLNLGYVRDLIGKSIEDITQDQQTIHTINQHNQLVLDSQRTLFFTESIICRDFESHAISIKMPWYDHAGRLLGIIGISHYSQAPCPSSNAADFTSLINKLRITSPTAPFMLQSNLTIKYSPREQDIIHLVLRGKTLKECADLLNLSKRTVEHYFANIKNKTGVNTRSELIDSFYPH